MKDFLSKLNLSGIVSDKLLKNELVSCDNGPDADDCNSRDDCDCDCAW